MTFKCSGNPSFFSPTKIPMEQRVHSEVKAVGFHLCISAKQHQEARIWSKKKNSRAPTFQEFLHEIITMRNLGQTAVQETQNTLAFSLRARPKKTKQTKNKTQNKTGSAELSHSRDKLSSSRPC